MQSCTHYYGAWVSSASISASCQAPGHQGFLAVCQSRGWATSSSRPPPVHSPHSQFRPKHCHHHPGHSLTLPHLTRPTQVPMTQAASQSSSPGASPPSRHQTCPCLPACLDLPCPLVPKPPRDTPVVYHTQSYCSPQVGTETSLLYHLLQSHPFALSFLPSSNPIQRLNSFAAFDITASTPSIAARRYHHAATHTTLATLLLVQLAA